MYVEPSGAATERGEGKGSEELRILRFPDVVKKTGLSKSAIYQRIRACEFPKPVALGPRAVGFVAHEVDGFIAGLIRRGRRPATLDSQRREFTAAAL